MITAPVRRGAMALVVALAAGASGACKDDPTSIPDATPITITDNAFTPVNLALGVGSRVRWRNSGAAIHDVTQQDGEFASGALDPNGTFDWVAEAPGSFRYSCTRHDGMSGTIVVE